MSKRSVLLTGASGSMGHEAFLELRRRREEFDVKLLLRPSKVNRRMFAPYEDEPWLEIVWGDLTNAEDVSRAVRGVEAVLHPAAMISPAADHAPEMARSINVGGTRNLIEAIHREPDGAERIQLVNVGSVAQYGDRLPPLETIRVGDPLRPSVHDYYALTKCEAEQLVVQSGIRQWASLRQTFICIPNLLSLLDPILFHQPLEQRIEFITSRDAGYGLVQALDAPDEFWRRIYNMSGGPSCRIVYRDFIDMMFRQFGLGDYQRIFDRNWFATQNFHCGYFEDSWELNEYTGHFRDGIDELLEQVDEGAALWMKLGARIAPAFVVRQLARRMADPLRWIEEDRHDYVNAFFGSRKAWEEIPGWDAPIEVKDGGPLDAHRIDDVEDLTHADLHAFADSRGGRCDSSDFLGPDTTHRWTCGRQHEFEATPRLLIHGGYWCPPCFPSVANSAEWSYEIQRAHDPLLDRFSR